MYKALETVDNLFHTSGWIVNKKTDSEIYRLYYPRHFELERFEIKAYSNGRYRTIIPIHNASFSVSVDEEDLYDFIYEHFMNQDANKFMELS